MTEPREDVEALLEACDAALEAVGARLEVAEETLRAIDVGYALTATEMRDRARAYFDRSEGEEPQPDPPLYDNRETAY